MQHALSAKLILFKEADLHFIARDTARQTSAIFLLKKHMNRAFPWCPLALWGKQHSKLHDCLTLLAPSALRKCFCFSINFSVPEARKGWGFLFHVSRLPCFLQAVLKVNKIDKTRLMSWGLDVFILYFEYVTSKPLMASTNPIIICQPSLAKVTNIDWALAKMSLIWESIFTGFVTLLWSTAAVLDDLCSSALSPFSFSLLLNYLIFVLDLTLVCYLLVLKIPKGFFILWRNSAAILHFL